MNRKRQKPLRLADYADRAWEAYLALKQGLLRSRRGGQFLPAFRSKNVSTLQAPLSWYLAAGGLSLAIFVCAIAPEQVRSLVFGDLSQAIVMKIEVPLPKLPSLNARKSPSNKMADLFRSPQSLGVLAIGHAEGNLTVSGQPTKLYYGHSDPGNFKRNQGWCSDQGRGGGNVVRADRECLKRMQQRLSVLERDLKAAGIDPQQETEVVLNAADLYNQASPWVSRQFPQKYAMARQQGKQGEEAMVWARVEAFRRNGRIDASGLIGICRREKRGLSDWNCVAGDQRRRVRAIARVLKQRSGFASAPFLFPAQGTITQYYSEIHPGIDIAGALGTPIIAAQGGTVVYAGWDDFGLGNVLKIQHPDGSFAVYGHNQRLVVSKGQQVKQGEAIAYMGSTGNSTGPHLHFEVRNKADDFVDPLPFVQP